MVGCRPRSTPLGRSSARSATRRPWRESGISARRRDTRPATTALTASSASPSPPTWDASQLGAGQAWPKCDPGVAEASRLLRVAAERRAAAAAARQRVDRGAARRHRSAHRHVPLLLSRVCVLRRPPRPAVVPLRLLPPAARAARALAPLLQPVCRGELRRHAARDGRGDRRAGQDRLGGRRGAQHADALRVRQRPVGGDGPRGWLGRPAAGRQVHDVRGRHPRTCRAPCRPAA
mmetsp:Transcript_33076/g.98414  ORF Transcript_33076/g.98414 Transcript_33076/m.98414 type:complete len:234 (-) Transcript_33076:836-1537(-)